MSPRRPGRRALHVEHESWPIRGSFTISRGSKTSAEVVTVTLREGEGEDRGRDRDERRGRGECVPYARYGESIAGVVEQIESVRAELESGCDREALQALLPAGAARNAVDCALWDLEARRAGRRVWQLLGEEAPSPVETAFTLSLGAPARMEEAARRNADRPLLKLKLGGPDPSRLDVERVRAVRRGAPDARLVLDANEGWDRAAYESMIDDFATLGVSMIEQPFPAGEDDALAELEHPIAICADESCHDSRSLAALVGRYDMVNLKLDKTGGLTEALRLRDEARRLELSLMVGCMVATSLAMAPALLLARDARIVDLDGPLLLAEDRPHGLVFEGSRVHPASAELWG